MFIWQQIALMAGVTAVIFLIILGPVLIVLTRFDRGPKDGPRCRKCGYDLRASEGMACPECGADLTRRGVWPINKPSRGPAIIALFIWSWLCVTLTSGSLIIWGEYQYDAVVHYELSRDLLLLYEPESEHYTYIAISGAGQGWVIAPPDDKSKKVSLDQIVIWVLTNEQPIAIAPVNARSFEIEEPINVVEFNEISDLYLKPVTYDSDSVESYLIESIKQHRPGIPIDEQLRAEMTQAIDIAKAISDTHASIAVEQQIPLSDPIALQDAVGKSLHFGAIQKGTWLDIEVDFLPAYSGLMIAAIGFCTWAIGIPLIRRWMYGRMAVSGVPPRDVPL